MDKLVKWAMEIQSLAQAGLAYTNNSSFAIKIVIL